MLTNLKAAVSSQGTNKTLRFQRAASKLGKMRSILVLSLTLAFCDVMAIDTINTHNVLDGPITDILMQHQIDRLKHAGLEPGKLDHKTQLRVFLYTWLAMERSEKG